MKLQMLLVLALFQAAGAAQPRYRVVDLAAGSGLDADPGYAFGVNDRGEVVGFVQMQSYAAHVFKYSLQSGMQDLVGPQWAVNTVGLCISAAGEIAGWAGYSAFRYNDAEGFVDLGRLGGGWAEANGINSLGEITGGAGIDPDDTDSYPRAFVYRNGTIKAIPGLMDGDSMGYGINDQGEVTGGAAGWAFLYSESDGVSYLGAGRGRAINNHGAIAGYSVVNQFGQGMAFLWREGEMRLLGSLGGSDSEAFGLNESNVVVGASLTRPLDGSYHSFIWTEAEGMQDLNALIADEPGWYLENAYAINNHGQIVGSGGDGGFIWEKAILLQPIPPVMAVELSGTNIIVSWSPDWPGVVLESKNLLLGGNWQPYPTQGTNVVAVAAGEGSRVFRLNLEALHGLAF